MPHVGGMQNCACAISKRNYGKIKRCTMMYSVRLCELNRCQFIIPSLIQAMGAGWSPCSKQTGTWCEFCTQVNTKYIYPHHSKFPQCGIHFTRVLLYTVTSNVRRKKKEPRLSKDGLEQHIQQLSDILMQARMSQHLDASMDVTQAF